MYRVYLQQRAGNWTHYGHELPLAEMVVDTLTACASGGWAVFVQGGTYVTTPTDTSWYNVTHEFEEKFRLQPLLERLEKRGE